jgi:hypothetical protein
MAGTNPLPARSAHDGSMHSVHHFSRGIPLLTFPRHSIDLNHLREVYPPATQLSRHGFNVGLESFRRKLVTLLPGRTRQLSESAESTEQRSSGQYPRMYCTNVAKKTVEVEQSCSDVSFFGSDNLRTVMGRVF